MMGLSTFDDDKRKKTGILLIERKKKKKVKREREKENTIKYGFNQFLLGFNLLCLFLFFFSPNSFN